MKILNLPPLHARISPLSISIKHKAAEKDPPKMTKWLRNAENCLYLWCNVLTVEYTDERLAGFKLCSGKENPDCRDEEYG